MRKIKKSKIQYFRLALLISVILFFCLVPISNWYANNKIAFNNPRLVGLADGIFAKYLYLILDSFYSLFDDPVSVATSSSGSMWAFSILGLPLSDPLGVISEIINSVKFPIKYLLGAIIPLMLAFTLGRVFCAWICPMALFFGISTKIKEIFKNVGIPILELKVPRETRIFVFWFGLVASYFMGMWVWHFILPYITFSHEIFSIVVFNTFTVGIYYFVAIIILDIGIISGEFCNSVCPTGWLLAQVGRLSILKLKVDRPNCPEKCKVCNIVCPIDLFPKEDKLFSCHLCLKCVDNCPKQHIKLDIRELYVRRN